MVLNRTATSGPIENPFAAILRGEGSPTLGLSESTSPRSLDFGGATDTGISPVPRQIDSGSGDLLTALGIGGATLGGLAGLSRLLKQSPEFEPGDDDFDFGVGLDDISGITSGLSKVGDLLSGGLENIGGFLSDPLSSLSSFFTPGGPVGTGLAGTGFLPGLTSSLNPAAVAFAPLAIGKALQTFRAGQDQTRKAQQAEIKRFTEPTSRFLDDVGIGRLAGETGMTNKFGMALLGLGGVERGPLHTALSQKLGGFSGDENANVAVSRNTGALVGLGLKDAEFNKDLKAFTEGKISRSAFTKSAKKASSRVKTSDEGKALADEAERTAFQRALGGSGGFLNVPERAFLPAEFQNFEPQEFTPGD
jgi:hypothetical protein